MPHVADGGRPRISSSNKIAPVEVDPPPTEIALTAARKGGGPVESQDQLAPVANEPGSFSPLGGGDVAPGGNKADISLQTGSDKVASQVVGVRTDDLAPPRLKGGGESEIDKGDSHHQGQEHGTGPVRGGYSVVSSTSESSGSGFQEYGHALKVAVTPDGKVITGRCLTYEDGRGGPLASNFFVSELHYSSANPSYHKRNKGPLKKCRDAGCTVT